MRIAILGAGAVGGLLAVLLERNGCDVLLVGRGERLRAIRERGLRLKTAAGTWEARPRTAEALEEQPDVLVLAVKAPALAELDVPAEVPLVAAVNGVPWWLPARLEGPLAGRRLTSVDPAGRLARVDVERVIGAVLYLTASMTAPGEVVAGPRGRILLGRPGGGGTLASQVARKLTACGYVGEATERIEAEVWQKLVANAANNPISALTGAETGPIFDDPRTYRLTVRVMEEVGRLGRALGLPAGQPPEEVIRVARTHGSFRTSMLQDLESGRPLELEALLGVLLELGGLVGVETPTVEMLYGLLRLKARVTPPAA